MSDDVEKQLEDIAAMFAQTAREMTTDGDRVTFRGCSRAACRPGANRTPCSSIPSAGRSRLSP